MTPADRPPVTDDARVEAERRYDLPLEITQGRYLPEGHARTDRVAAFVAGAEWAASRAVPSDRPATTEDAYEVIRQAVVSTSDGSNLDTIKAVRDALDVAGLLATARTRATLAKVSLRLALEMDCERVYDDNANAYYCNEHDVGWLSDTNQCARAERLADAVLALWADQPETTTATTEDAEDAIEEALHTYGHVRSGGFDGDHYIVDGLLSEVVRAVVHTLRERGLLARPTPSRAPMSDLTRCTNERIENGHIVPCERPAVAMRIDPEFEHYGPYPVCVGHTRHPMVPLAQALAPPSRDQIARTTCGATTNTAGPCVLDPEHITVSAHAGPSGWRWNDSATMARFDTDGGTDESL